MQGSSDADSSNAFTFTVENTQCVLSQTIIDISVGTGRAGGANPQYFTFKNSYMQYRSPGQECHRLFLEYVGRSRLRTCLYLKWEKRKFRIA